MTDLNNNWQDKIGCFTPNATVEDVMGKPINFYPVSVGLMFQLRAIGKPLARSLAVLFSKQDNDRGSRNVMIQREDAGIPDQEIVVDPISEGLAKIRHEQRADAIEGIITSLTEPAHIEVVGKIIMDSMRDVFPPGDQNNPPAQEFINTLPTPALTACLIGVAKANKGVFGPLADQVTEAITASVARIQKENVKPDDEPTLTPKQDETVPSTETAG